MQNHSIISNTISEEILQTGKLSIRFMTDGFSLLLIDKDYRPVILNRFTQENSHTKSGILNSCEEWLSRHTLLDNFFGEVTIVTDSVSSVLVPKELFSKENKHIYLENANEILSSGTISHTSLKNRPLVVVFDISSKVDLLASSFSGKTRVIPASSVLFSMCDQINAADHQRGFCLIEVQNGELHVLIINEDQTIICNQLKLNKNEDMIYFTLNTLEHLQFDRKNRPVFYSGNVSDHELTVLRKYIRNVQPLPYFIFDIDKAAITEHILLAEATRCE